MPTAKASASTVRRRSHEIDGVRKRASGEDESAQLTDEILSRPRKEKQVLVKSLNGRVQLQGGSSGISEPCTQGRFADPMEQTARHEEVN